MGGAIGIDLGTTNSVAAIATPQGVQLATGASGETVHPSVVSFPESGGVLIGLEASARKTSAPTQTIYSAKRLIGQNIKAPMVQLAAASLPFAVEEGTNQQPIIRAGGRRLTVPEVSALVLGHLQKLCQQQFQTEAARAVVTVPANFSDAQRRGTKEAGRVAGIDIMRLINEPTAAALAYGYGQATDATVAVFDFGGGTFDVSVLAIKNDIFEVLASDGEFFLGGDDIDRIIAEYLAAEFNRQNSCDPRPFPSAMSRLTVAAEHVKKYLSDNDAAEGSIDGIVAEASGRTMTLDFSITRRQFDNMIAGYVDRTVEICRQVLTTSGVDPRSVSDVIMVGGSTRIPAVRERVAELFGREPATRINPDEVVAHGAAIQAAMLSGEVVPASQEARPAEHTEALDLVELAAGGGALLLDVAPATLGIATVGGFSEALVLKNSPIPIEHTRVFTTAHDNQTSVVIDCCRGEERRFAENEPIGTLSLEDLPPALRGDTEVQVTFRVDADGILNVRALDARSGASREAQLHLLGVDSDEGGTEAAE